jgi:mono/diheme cytochrome c family protein
MKIKLIITFFTILTCVFVFSQCTEIGSDKGTNLKPSFGGFDSQIKWGEHLVIIGGCGDCHTPKKMTPQGPVLDNSLMLSGHPAQKPPPDVDRKEMESKGLVVTDDLTGWVGPWGVSFAANLTPDATGIGNWQESNFVTALREGKYKGMPNGRTLLPPMPWEFYKEMSEDEIKAIFAYLKSNKPISNLVPQPIPPVMAGQPPPEAGSK